MKTWENETEDTFAYCKIKLSLLNKFIMCNKREDFKTLGSPQLHQSISVGKYPLISYILYSFIKLSILHLNPLSPCDNDT